LVKACAAQSTITGKHGKGNNHGDTESTEKGRTMQIAK